ncbi:hypothetical protein MAGR_51350 [Mycolicibacterium agri]|uniref:Uncharacterized protein n=1 Tax=Mycolicibacterium agri TaxID=36811 RepID=A0A7I9W7M3_MYCAG|nr:hypothetical protein MAGR_51350 [Mycolicibacterium agri]
MSRADELEQFRQADDVGGCVSPGHRASLASVPESKSDKSANPPFAANLLGTVIDYANIRMSPEGIGTWR